MSNESQQVYKTVMDKYARISHIQRLSIRPSTKVSRYYRQKLAKELSEICCVPINNPDKLVSIVDFAEYLKRHNMERLLPEIENEVRQILKNFFVTREFSKDELIFEGIPDPLYKICYDVFRQEVSKRFKINLYFIFRQDIFQRNFSIAEIVDWIYLNEKAT